MTIIVILLPAALVLGFLGLVAFLWSLRSKQFEDLDGAAVRSLLDRDIPVARGGQITPREQHRP